MSGWPSESVNNFNFWLKSMRNASMSVYSFRCNSMIHCTKTPSPVSMGAVNIRRPGTSIKFCPGLDL